MKVLKDVYFDAKKGVFKEATMETIHTELTVSVTELKRNYAAVLSSAQNSPIAVLNHNKPEAYLLSARHYEHLLEQLEDMHDRGIVIDRSQGPFTEVSLDEL